jgi:hypothetical protein
MDMATMLILEILGGIFAGLLMLGLLAILRSVLDSASSRATTGFDLRRNRRMKSDWRVLESLSIGNEQD